MRDEFIYKAQGGKDAVLYAGLLNEAHEKGLISIETELLQIPTVENAGIAISKAKVTMQDGETIKSFTGIGDAATASVARGMGLHIIRMSETRAKARALRDAINVGMVCFEELGGDDEQSHTQTAKPPQTARQGNWRDDPKVIAAATEAVKPKEQPIQSTEPLPVYKLTDPISAEHSAKIKARCLLLQVDVPAMDDWTRQTGVDFWKNNLAENTIPVEPDETQKPVGIFPDEIETIIYLSKQLGANPPPNLKTMTHDAAVIMIGKARKKLEGVEQAA